MKTASVGTKTGLPRPQHGPRFIFSRQRDDWSFTAAWIEFRV